MEYRRKRDEETKKMLKSIIREMATVGIVFILLGLIGFVVFHYTGKYLIHPAVYFVAVAGGTFTSLTAGIMYLNLVVRKR
jgi:ABC-type antimicrobial peptide transport system permease subunit